MKRFICTKFILTLQESSQKGGNVNTPEMTSEYDTFATFVFLESGNFPNRTKYREALVYTLSELAGLSKYLRKKTSKFINKAISLINSEIEWTEKQILTVQSAQTNPLATQLSGKNTLQWTGSKIELVELIYALHETECFKDVSLKALFAAIGEQVGCEVKNYSRLFWGIIERIKGDRTPFLDKLKRVIITRFKKSDEKPSRK